MNALSIKMYSIPPAQEGAHAEAKHKGTLALYGTRAGKTSSARKLFPGRPLPDQKAFKPGAYNPLNDTCSSLGNFGFSP